MANNNSFFSLVTGLAAGAILGILFAPDKGWKTRARVKKAAENGFEDFREDFDEFSGKVSDKVGEKASGVMEKILDQLDRLEKTLRGENAADAPAEEGGVDEQNGEQE